jgi:hypothetical protein
MAILSVRVVAYSFSEPASSTRLCVSVAGEIAPAVFCNCFRGAASVGLKNFSVAHGQVRYKIRGDGDLLFGQFCFAPRRTGCRAAREWSGMIVLIQLDVRSATVNE